MPQELPQSGEDVVFAPAPFHHRFADGLSGPLSGQRLAFAAVAVGGALGAPARYLLGLALPTEPGRFPVGTFAVIVAGGLAIGVLTTYSTFGYETVMLASRRAWLFAALNAFGSLATGPGAATLGLAL